MPRPSPVPGLDRRQLVGVLSALLCATLLSSLDVSVLSTALPTIVGEFGAFERFAWVGTAYVVTSTIATPLLGKLSDLYGRRTIFQVTVALFAIGSLLCGLSQSMNQLIAARAVQGLGGGGINSLAFAIVGDLMPPRMRGRYIGYFTGTFALAALAGPLVGGFVIEHFAWQWIFLINVPLCIGVLVLSQRNLQFPFPRRQARIDVVGLVLMSIGLGTLMVALERGRTSWSNTLTLTLFVVAAVALTAFVVAESKVAEPMIPLRLFRSKVVVICCGTGFLASITMNATTGFLPLFFQDALFVSPTESGLRTLPAMLGVVASSIFGGRLIARGAHYKPFPIIGFSLSIAGLLWVSQIDGGTRYATLILPMFAIGWGLSGAFTTGSIATQNAVPITDLGIGTANLMFFRSLGGAIGFAVLGTTLNRAVRSELPARLGVSADEATDLIRAPEQIEALDPSTRDAVIDALTTGISHIFWLAAGAAALGLVLSFFLPELPLRDKAGITDAMTESTP